MISYSGVIQYLQQRMRVQVLYVSSGCYILCFRPSGVSNRKPFNTTHSINQLDCSECNTILRITAVESPTASGAPRAGGPLARGLNPAELKGLTGGDCAPMQPQYAFVLGIPGEVLGIE